MVVVGSALTPSLSEGIEMPSESLLTDTSITPALAEALGSSESEPPWGGAALVDRALSRAWSSNQEERLSSVEWVIAFVRRF